MPEPFLAPDAPVIVQGMTGRAGRTHTLAMQRYGTNIVGGVSPRDEDVGGLPVFRDCAEAVAATGAVASVAIVPPLAVLPAIAEAVAAGIRTVVTITEGMPIHDAVRARHLVRAAGARWVGASTPGIAIPGRMKLGFLPDASLAPGRLGVMAKSGTLSYEVCHRLVQRGLGQSLWVGVGGDPVKGTRFAEMLPWYAADPGTDALVIVGEIGGNEEEELAETIRAQRFAKPVYALVAGQAAREGVTMGHAGALIHGSAGTVESKLAALRGAGAQVFTRIQDLVEAVAG
ncbi:MAG: succinate--CoA ligase subunit alpha [Novosphingobium sp.]|nr:succinate--CoA ligase subunit alpha [Novosphingobium sp.]